MNVVSIAPQVGLRELPAASRIKLRSARADDAARCGKICFLAFKTISEQHNFPPDFHAPEPAIDLMSFLVSAPFIYSVVAEFDGKVVGSNFLWENASIAGVGPITIDPSFQNGEIGLALMLRVLERAREQRFAGVRLVQAAYHQRSLALYTKLGFDAREPLSTMQGPAIHEVVPGYPVRSATAVDLDACNRLCLRIHRHIRSQELSAAIVQGTANIVEHGGRITGYSTNIGFFGHAVGESNNELKALISAAPSYLGPGFLLPTRNGELMRWCLAKGLRIVQPMTLMSVGLYSEPSGGFPAFYPLLTSHNSHHEPYRATSQETRHGRIAYRACFCGAVEIEVTGAPLEMGYCHCSSCRSYSGAPVNAFSLWKSEDVKVIKGAEFLGRFNKTEMSHRQFCRRCGGHMTEHHALGLTDVYAAVIPSLVFKPSVHLNYAETVLPLKDGLLKLKDFPPKWAEPARRCPNSFLNRN
jgi:predicted N-acetyltransferase YhbS